MGLSLKKEEMIRYLEDAKAQGEYFKCMLWGTVYAKFSSFQNRSAATWIMAFSAAPGVAGSLNNCFCYIGLTDQSIYVIALDAYNTSKIIGTFALPFANFTSLKIHKTFLGASHRVEIDCGERIWLTVKSPSIGTNIKDQKAQMEEFLASIAVLKSGFSG